MKEKESKTKVSLGIVATLILLPVLERLFTPLYDANLNITRSTNNIEIVAAYISDYDYKILKSNFHTISSRSDFDSFNRLLTEYADKAGIKLK